MPHIVFKIVLGTQGYSNNGHTYFCNVNGNTEVRNYRVGTEAYSLKAK